MTRQVLTRKLGTVAVLALLAGCASSTEVSPATGEVPPATREVPAASGESSEAAPASTTAPAATRSTTEVRTDQAVDVSLEAAPDPGSSERSDDVTPAPARSITIGGMGADYGPPDRSVVDVGVSARRPSVEEATRQASAAGESLLAALRAAGVPTDGIQTSQFSISPYHDQHDYTVVVGYETNIGYRVTVDDVADLGEVLARAVDAGGDSVRAWSVRFEGDPDGHMDAARAQAWDDVRARAAATAEQIGELLGEVLDVHEKVLVTSPQGMMQGGEGDSASFDIPVSPGVVGVVVLLTVTYAIGI